jgi:hypothetical protein
MPAILADLLPIIMQLVQVMVQHAATIPAQGGIVMPSKPAPLQPIIPVVQPAGVATHSITAAQANALGWTGNLPTGVTIVG